MVTPRRKSSRSSLFRHLTISTTTDPQLQEDHKEGGGERSYLHDLHTRPLQVSLTLMKPATSGQDTQRQESALPIEDNGAPIYQPSTSTTQDTKPVDETRVNSVLRSVLFIMTSPTRTNILNISGSKQRPKDSIKDAKKEGEGQDRSRRIIQKKKSKG